MRIYCDESDGTFSNHRLYIGNFPTDTNTRAMELLVNKVFPNIRNEATYHQWLSDRVISSNEF